MIEFRKWKADIQNVSNEKEMTIEFYTLDNEKPNEKLDIILGSTIDYSNIQEIEDNE